MYTQIYWMNKNSNLGWTKSMKLNIIWLLRLKKENYWAKGLVNILLFFYYFDKSLIVLSVTAVSVSIASFATVTGAPVGILSASFSLAFSISTGLVKKLLKTTRNKKKKHNKIVMLARSKLNSIESKISKVLKNNGIKHEDFDTIIDEEKKYRKLKETIKMMNSQRSDAEKIKLIEEAKKISINEVIYNSLKP